MQDHSVLRELGDPREAGQSPRPHEPYATLQKRGASPVSCRLHDAPRARQWYGRPIDVVPLGSWGLLGQQGAEQA